jgi:putative transposase
MIDHTHPLSIVRQCQLLGVARSTAYYRPTPVAAAVLGLMRRIDELHLEYPFAGARMLRDLLRQEGQRVGRRHVATLMRRMGITAIYRKPRTSQRHPAHRVYPYLLRTLAITRRLIGQVLPVHKWRLAVWAYAADGCADRFSQYTQSGVRPSRARCGLR